MSTQPQRREALDEAAGDRGGEQRVAGSDELDGADQVLRRDVLDQEPACPGGQGRVDVLVEVERGQDDDPRPPSRGVGAVDAPGRLLPRRHRQQGRRHLPDRQREPHGHGGHRRGGIPAGQRHRPGHVAPDAGRDRPGGERTRPVPGRAQAGSQPPGLRERAQRRARRGLRSGHRERRRQGPACRGRPGRDADAADHGRRGPRRAEHGRAPDPRARPRHRRVQGPWHDTAADARHDHLLGGDHRAGRGDHRGPGGNPPAPRRDPGDDPRGQLRLPALADLGPAGTQYLPYCCCQR